jgi:hypothetical protein
LISHFGKRKILKISISGDFAIVKTRIQKLLYRQYLLHTFCCAQDTLIPAVFVRLQFPFPRIGETMATYPPETGGTVINTLPNAPQVLHDMEFRTAGRDFHVGSNTYHISATNMTLRHPSALQNAVPSTKSSQRTCSLCFWLRSITWSIFSQIRIVRTLSNQALISYFLIIEPTLFRSYHLRIWTTNYQTLQGRRGPRRMFAACGPLEVGWHAGDQNLESLTGKVRQRARQSLSPDILEPTVLQIHSE